MTQPRSAQIKSVNTRYSVLQCLITPGSPSSSIAPSSFPGSPGGADQDVPGFVRGSAVSPFAVLAGDTLSVRLDGAPAVLVVLGSTDTTVGRICLRINASVHASVASDDLGHLVLRSPTLGSQSSVALADVTPGILSKLGITAGTYAGKSAPSDGVITLSPDLLGGTAPLSTTDGRNLVTDGGKLVYFARSSPSGRRMMQLLPGGSPVVAKLTFDGTNFVASHYSRLTPRARLRTLGASFQLLGNTDSLTLNVNGVAFSTTFSSGPYTRDTAMAAINASYAAAAGITDTWARVDGTSPSPYGGLSGTSFLVEVNGGSPQAVTFSSETSAQEVADRINNVVIGVTASVVSGPNGKFLSIVSNNATGQVSSIKIYSGDQSLSRLGIRAGHYGGCYVADSYGPDEIEIFSVFRGYGSSGLPEITVSGSPTTLSRMGISSTFVPGATSPAYEPVPAPYLLPDMSASVPYDALMAFPDVLEFGQVPPDADSVIQRFLAKSAGTNVDTRNRPVDDRQDGTIGSGLVSRGFFDVGKPVITALDGSLPGVGGGSEPVDAIVKQITRLSPAAVVQAVAASRLETPGNGGNPLPPAPIMDMYADPTNSFAARGFRMFVNPASRAVSVMDDASGATPLLRSFLGVHGPRSIYFPDEGAKISDVNIAAADPTNGYMLVTSTGDDYLRVGGVSALPSRPNVAGYNLLRSVNARYDVYVGDGVTTTGDFNGHDALSQAIQFLRSQGVIRCRVTMKPGNYSEPSPVSLAGFSDFELEGPFPHGDSAPVVMHASFPGAVISCPDHLSTFTCRNISFTAFDITQPILQVDAQSVLVEDCALDSPASFLNPGYLRILRCSSPCQQAGPVVVTYDDTSASDVDGILIEDCLLTSGQDFPILSVLDNTGFELVRIENVTVNRCVTRPGTATFTGVDSTINPRVFVSPVGAGIVSLVPRGNAFGPSPTGLAVRHLNVLSTVATLGSNGTFANASFVALNIVPSGPGGDGTWIYRTSPAVAIDNVRVEDLFVSFPTGSLQIQSQSPCIAIGGVGVFRSFPSYPASHGIGTLSFKRVYVDVEFNIHGPITSNMIPFFNEYSTVPSNAPSNQSGLVCLSGYSVVAEDMVFEKTMNLCGSPELFVVPYGHLSVRGVEIRPTSFPSVPVTTLTLSQSRIWIRDVYGAVMSVRDLVIDGAGQPDAHWANKGMLVLEGCIGTRVACSVSDFLIQNFFFDFAVPGIAILNVAGHSTWPTNLKGGGVLIERGYVGNSFIGSTSTNGFSNGIAAIVAAPNVLMDNIHVRDVTIDSTQGNGIILSLSAMNHPSSVEDCQVLLCGNLTGSSGIKLSSQKAGTNFAARFTVRDNDCYMNNTVQIGGYTGTQINVREVGSAFRPTTASVYGNNCIDNVSQSFGQINSCLNSNTNLPGSGSASGSSVFVLGVETGYSGQTGSFASIGNGLLWTAGSRCIHNLALLGISFSNTQ